MDKIIEDGNRIRLAKVCVEFDAKGGFTNEFDLEMFDG